MSEPETTPIVNPSVPATDSAPAPVEPVNPSASAVEEKQFEAFQQKLKDRGESQDADAEPAADSVTTPAEPGSGAAKPDDSAQAEPEGYADAMQAHRRAQTPKSVLDGMDKAELVEWGLRLREQQAQNDAFSAMYGQTLQAMRSGQASPAPGAAPPTAEPGAENIAKIRDEYGDAMADYAIQQQKIIADTRAENQRQADVVQKLLVSHQKQQCDQAREALLSDFPSLKDKQAFGKVWDHMVMLSNAPGADQRYGSGLDIDAKLLMRDSALAILGPESTIQASQRLIEESKHQRRSGSTPPDKVASHAPATFEDYQFQVWQLQRQGKHEEARRLPKPTKR